ncbi:coiled-coil domain-containing protein [Thalassotalea eurytherma]|uniref:FkbM family methyltransferase n=1 Tax=Thalassotalea eurytherma TaxID=1144278 RepID=A0ABQ6GZD3_9GAMM|nr:hypothetical protein [Thalassotalea eurytherma]GLX81298.1 hypothetical protein theurythT_07500 [Thalassotalea eurytherma]
MNKSIYTKLLERKIELDNVGTIIHVGAGLCAELAFYQELKPKQLILIEAAESQFEQLQEKVNNSLIKNNTACLNKALVNEGMNNHVDFFITQPAQFSGLQEPEAIKKVFKNTSITSKQKVEATSLEYLVDDFSVQSNDLSLLVLQLNGAEQQILEGVKPSTLETFDFVVIQTINHAINASSGQQEDLIKRLDNYCFDHVVTQAHDLVFENTVFVLNKEKLAHTKLIKKLSSLENENQKHINTIQSLENQLVKKDESYSLLEQKIEQLIASNNEQRVAAKDVYNQHKQTIEQINDSHQEALDRAATELTQKSNRINELQLCLTQAQEQQTKLNNQVAELKSYIEDAQNEYQQKVGIQSKYTEKLKSEKTSLVEQVNSTTKVLETEREQSSSKIEQLQAQVATLTKERDEQKRSRQGSKTQIESLNEHVQTLQKKLDDNEDIEQKLHEAVLQKDQEHKRYLEHKDWAGSLNKEVEALNLELRKSVEKNEQQAESLNDKLHWCQVHKERTEVAKTKVLELEKQLEEKDAVISHLESKQSEETQSMLDALVKQVNVNHKNELAEMKRNLDWSLEQGFNNSVKQVESFIGVQSYLETGKLAMEYHGWPISSDIALFLLGKIENNNYDLIIEFGSGTSTKLFAQALAKKSSSESVISIENKTEQMGKYVDDLTYVSNFANELPQRVLTFEHNKKYHEKTLLSLKQANLDGVVNLVHAPLVNFVCDEKPYLYYDCDNALAQIADIFRNRVAKVLVLIDGPPGATGPLARLPAVTKLLNHLGSHQLDLVLDDYNRQEEKNIAVHWKKTIESRFITYMEELVPCEKGAWFCQLNV